MGTELMNILELWMHFPSKELVITQKQTEEAHLNRYQTLCFLYAK